MLFQNRAQAGQKLAAALLPYRNAPNTLTLSLPCGGVVVGAAVAAELHLPHDIVVARKIGAPGNPEFAIGAVTALGEPLLDKETIQTLGVSQEYLERTIAEERAEAQRRLELYRAGKPALDVKNKTIILVDDGLATGATMAAAIKWLKTEQPSRIIAAVPVAPQDTLDIIAREVDEVVCLSVPSYFGAVGAWYSEFPQVSDQKVIASLT